MSCGCNSRNRTKVDVTFVPSAAASATDNRWMVSVLQRLCGRICVSGPQPIFNLAFAYVGSEQSGNNYSILNFTVKGTITYQPYGNGPCCNRTDIVDGTFSITAFNEAGGAPISVDITPSATVGNPANVGVCCQTTKDFLMETPLEVVVTFPAAPAA